MIIFSNEEAFFKSKGIKYREGQRNPIVLPKTAIAVYSRELFYRFITTFFTKEVGYLSLANFEKNIYVLRHKGLCFTLFMAGVSGPIISADIEALAASGVEKFIIFGNCGVLHEHIDDLKIIIPTRAYRDEGTSQHYIPDSEYIDVNPKYQEIFKDVLGDYSLDFETGYTWTTDAFFRETPSKIEYFRNKGCVCVEMEAATIAAVCKAKGLDYFTFFYAGDNLGGKEWDERSLSGKARLDEKAKLLHLALDFAVEID